MSLRFLVSVVLLSSSSFSANAVIDYQPDGLGYGQFIAANDPTHGNVWTGISQSFTAQDSNIKFDFYASNFSTTQQIELSIYSGDGVFNNSNLLGQQLVNVNKDLATYSGGKWTGYEKIEADFSNINLTVGNVYTVAATLPSQGLPASGTESPVELAFAGSNPTDPRPYTGGYFYYLGSSFPNSWFFDRTIAFTASPVSAVPVPAAVWLFGSALGGLSLFGQRRKLN
jgi:hypothetical protein